MTTTIEPVALTTDGDKTLDHVTQVLGPNAEIKTMSRPQELADKGDDQDPDMVILRELAQATEDANDPAADPAAPLTPEDEAEIADALPTPKAAKPEGNAKPSSIMIPKERLDTEIRKREDAENKANYFRGLADASKQMATTTRTAAQPPAVPEQPSGPTYAEQLAQLDQQRITLAEAYDKGDLTSVDWKKQELAVEQQIRALQSHQEETRMLVVRQEAATAATEAAQLSELNRVTAQLEQQYPYCNQMQTEDWAVLNVKATRQLLSEGRFTQQQLANDLAGQIAFRHRIAELTNTIGADLIGKPRIVAGQPAADPVEGVTTQVDGKPEKKGLSETAQARKAKLDLAKTQPPTTSTIGNGGTQNEISMADVDRMSEEELAALPPAVMKRLLAA